MGARVYLQLDTPDGTSHEVASILRNIPGVIMTDVLAGLPRVICVLDAPRHQELAGLTTRVFSAVGDLVEEVRLRYRYCPS